MRARLKTHAKDQSPIRFAINGPHDEALSFRSEHIGDST